MKKLKYLNLEFNDITNIKSLGKIKWKMLEDINLGGNRILNIKGQEFGRILVKNKNGAVFNMLSLQHYKEIYEKGIFNDISFFFKLEIQ